MRLAASFVLLASLFVSTSASAQAYSSTALACEAGDMSACLELAYGRCMHDDPRIAIAACTRQLLSNRDSLWDDRLGSVHTPENQAVRYSLRATAYTKLGEFDRALADYRRAIRAKGDIFWIHALRGSALFSVGYEQEALASFDEAISLEPDNALLLNARARVLSSAVDDNVRNGPRAITDAQRASELQPGQPAFIAALATAYAENGEFERAVEIQQQAIDLLQPGDLETRETYASRLALYQNGKPFRREIACGTDGDSGQDSENDGATLAPYIVFCLPDGTARGSRVPDVP
jgi:tetratricopeptide (TPR) repeat protein